MKPIAGTSAQRAASIPQSRMEDDPKDPDRLERLRAELARLRTSLKSLADQHEQITTRIANLANQAKSQVADGDDRPSNGASP